MQDLDYLLPIVPCDRVVGESIAEVHLGRRHRDQVVVAGLRQLRVLPAPLEALVVQHARVEDGDDVRWVELLAVGQLPHARLAPPVVLVGHEL